MLVGGHQVETFYTDVFLTMILNVSKQKRFFQVFIFWRHTDTETPENQGISPALQMASAFPADGDKQANRAQ